MAPRAETYLHLDLKFSYYIFCFLIQNYFINLQAASITFWGEFRDNFPIWTIILEY